MVPEPEAWSWPCRLCPCIFLSDTPLKRDPGSEQHQEEERESSDAPGQTSHPGCVCNLRESCSVPAHCGHLVSSKHRTSSRMCCPEPCLGFTHWVKSSVHKSFWFCAIQNMTKGLISSLQPLSGFLTSDKALGMYLRGEEHL